MKKDYDVIIIGSGIGGLTCGCYLAKAGMKVLIIEQHHKVGGYCTSFSRRGFTFEAGAIEDLAEGSFFRKVISEFGIDKKINITQHSPNLIIFTDDERIRLDVELNEIIQYFQKHWPSETYSIEKFFKLISDYNIQLLYLKYRNKTFDNLLDEYFKNEKLKTTLRIISSQIGAASNQASALSVITYYKTFILSGGYYPMGGLQKFSDCFSNSFRELGGEILLENLTKEIIIDDNKSRGVFLASGRKILSDFVVSNADATQTFFNLIGERYLKKTFVDKFKKLKPSISPFFVYLGINKKLRDDYEDCHEVWYITSKGKDDPFNKYRLRKRKLDLNIYCYLPSFRDPSMAPLNCESMSAGIFTLPMERKYWDLNKDLIAGKILQRINKVIPFSEKDIIVKEIAVPQTFYRYTLNKNGAFKGWAPFLSQVNISTMPPQTSIENLYLAGHWVTTAVGETGIPQAVYVGHRVANLILKTKRGK